MSRRRLRSSASVGASASSTRSLSAAARRFGATLAVIAASAAAASCGDDRAPIASIGPPGYVALGEATAFTDGSAGAVRGAHAIDFTVPCDLSRAPDGAPSSRVVIVEKRVGGHVVVTPVSNLTVDAAAGRARFRGDEYGTYQCAIPAGAGHAETRHFTYRALAGVSMGGLGSSVNFFTHPERYDALAVMGADPGPDLTYTLGILRDWFFGGFCTAADEKAGRGKVGETCPLRRKPRTDLGEVSFDFEHLYYQRGDGVGLTLRRDLYVRAFRDLSRAFGNAAYASAEGGSTYLPPGVDPSTLARTGADACAHPTVLDHFYDRSFNPDGALPVITVCDGNDGDRLGLGVFDPTIAAQNPTQIMLAVDVNKNGRRDPGEPIVLQGAEPFEDVGADGLPDEKEPGYDARTNPDPNGDDYDPLHNPTGTEGNWRWDPGEPFEDTGVDGVAGKGCEVGSAPGCYDQGEGNGKFDYNRNARRWYDHDPRTLLERLDAAALHRLDVYYDAGIHDFLNAQVSTASLAAALHGRGEHVRVWEGFPSLVDAAPSAESKFRVTDVDFARLGRHAYVRYGDPDASPAQVEMTGDGRHVGTVLQATHRAQMLFAFLSHAWPGGDVDVSGDLSGGDSRNATFTTSWGRVTPYSVVLPPGYGATTNAIKRYPIVYLMHGYGMQPKDLAQVAVIAQGEMVNDRVPDARRLQKMIIVTVDGACRPGGSIGAGDPLPAGGDLCEEGTFYSDHPEGTAKMQSLLLELQAEVESKYRVKAPEDRTVRQ